MDAPCRELISWIVLSILLTTELEIGGGGDGRILRLEISILSRSGNRF